MNNYIIFSANYPPHIGGVERYSEAIACELAKRGNNVYIVTSQYGDLRHEEQISDHLKIFRAPSRMLLEGRMPILQNSKKWKEIKKKISEIKNPRVIIQTFLYPLSYAARNLARKMKWEYIVINHGCNYVCQGKTMVDRAEHLYERFMARRIGEGSYGCYSVSKEAEKWAIHFLQKSAGILHNGISVSETEETLKKLPYGVRKEFGIDPGRYTVAFIGRMIKEKGIIQLIEAAKLFDQEDENFMLIAVGAGEELEGLKARKTKNVIFTDNISHDEVLRILRECDCCCLPSDSEGLPTVLLEAALAGCFLISSPYGGSPEVVGEYGIVMKDNTCESIYESLKYAIHSKSDMEQIRNQNRIRIEKMFSWDSVCDRIEGITWGKREN